SRTTAAPVSTSATATKARVFFISVVIVSPRLARRSSRSGDPVRVRAEVLAALAGQEHHQAQHRRGGPRQSPGERPDIVLDLADVLLALGLALLHLAPLLVVDARLLHVEPAVGDLLEVHQEDLLGPLVDVRAGADALDLLVEVLLGEAQLLLGGVLGGL